MSNFNKGMQYSCKMNDPNFILQSQNDLITESHFLILDPLDILEHFAGVHFHLKPSKLWLEWLQGSMQIQVRQTVIVTKCQFSSVQFSCSVMSDILQPMDCSVPGLPVYHQHLELTQTHIHWISDAIQPSHPLSSPSAPTFNLSQHQGLFKWVSPSHEVQDANI